MTKISPSGPEPDALAAVRSDHYCFGCGAQNPFGLHLAFTTTASGVSAPFTPAVNHQGFEEIVHGGIISAALDEAMAWAIAAAGHWAVTGEIRVRFRKPLHVGEATTLHAEVTSTRGRLISASATLRAGHDGAEIAFATATFMQVDEVTAAAWRGRYLQSGAQNLLS